MNRTGTTPHHSQTMLQTFSVPRKPKSEVARLLGMNIRTIYDYLKNLETFEDFMNDYPQIGGRYVTKAGLTEYQIWVIKCLQFMIKQGMKFSDLTIVETQGKMSFKVLDKSLEKALSKSSYGKQIESYYQVA